MQMRKIMFFPSLLDTTFPFSLTYLALFPAHSSTLNLLAEERQEVAQWMNEWMKATVNKNEKDWVSFPSCFKKHDPLSSVTIFLAFDSHPAFIWISLEVWSYACVGLFEFQALQHKLGYKMRNSTLYLAMRDGSRLSSSSWTENWRNDVLVEWKI